MVPENSNDPRINLDENINDEQQKITNGKEPKSLSKS
jgi:hypothetical protein